MNLLDAFLDGVTGAGLFGKLNWPGAPTELIDSRSPEEFNAKLAAQKLYAEKFPSVHLKSANRSASSEQQLRKE